MNEPLPTKEDFDGWLQLPLTRMILREFPKRKIQAIQDAWANGEYSFPLIEAAALKNAEKIGEISAWKDIQEFDYEALLTEIDDGSNYGAQPGDDPGAGG